jgi:two-component system, NarL family, sensor histidine kinase UhpB
MTAPPLPTPPHMAPGGLFTGPCAQLVSALREAIVMVDEAQTIVAMNPAAEQLLACEPAQTLGTSLERFVPPRWREQHAVMVRGFAASHTARHLMRQGRRVDLLRADGSTVPVEIALSRIDMVDQGRQRTLFAAMLRDTSDAHVLEEQLAAIERRMRAVFELSPSAIWICEDDVLTYANRAAARLFGMDSIDGLIGRHVWSLLDEDSHAPLRQEIERTLAGQTVGAIVGGRLTRGDGQRREIEIALAALPDHGRRTVQMVVSDVTERRREASALERSRRDLRELSASVVEAREEERRRIARELHDELGQRLTALKIDLATLAAQAPLAADDARVAAMQAMLDDTLASVRRIASDLRPLMLDDLGLNAAIEWLARDASRRIGIPVHTRLPLVEPALDPRLATAIYRMVQEALTNVARHARARSVEVILQTQNTQIVLTVADDGIGLSDQALQRAGSFGLMGLRERAHILGGTIAIGARPGGGTRLTVRLPPQPPPNQAPLP